MLTHHLSDDIDEVDQPLDPEELIAGLESLGSRLRIASRAPDTLLLKVANLKICGPLGEALLSAGEVTILSAFARAPGRSLERWQLLEVIGGDGPTAPSAGTMEMRLTRLRKKLTTIGAEPPGIKAIHKVGYTLCTALVIA